MKIPLEVVVVRASCVEGLSDVILLNRSSNSVICVSVGEYEAKLIALSVDKKELLKPIMFDSFVNMIYYFGIELEYVLIDSFKDGVYGATVYCKSDKEKGVFNMRVSDAMNLALRAECPIYIYESLFEEVGFDAEFLIEQNPIKEEPDVCSKVSDFNLEMLEEMLEDAVENEDYELAVLLRDKINEMKENKEGNV